jgi:hypothetical protein
MTNNEKYQGNFHDDFVHGEGIYFKMDNTAIRGIWNHNKLLNIF